MLEWVVKILEALAKGRFTGSVNIRFKDGGISSITRPKDKGGSLREDIDKDFYMPKY
jgi:hypothetical protein